MEGEDWSPGLMAGPPPLPNRSARWLGRGDGAGFREALKRAIGQAGSPDRLDARALEALRAYRVTADQARSETLALIGWMGAHLERADFEAGARSALTRLGAAFKVPAGAVANALQARALEIYQAAVEAAGADERVTNAEWDELGALAGRLGLEAPQTEAAFREMVCKKVDAYLAQALADGELSPEEDLGLSDLMEALRVIPSYEAKTLEALNAARHAWALHHAPLAEIAAPIALQRGETAYALTQATAYEPRTRTTSVRYGGPSYRVRIAKGLSYRVGGYHVSRQTEDYQHALAQGPLVATGKRLVFMGDKRAITVKLDAILDIEPYADGVGIARSSGKPVTFVFDAPNPDFAQILMRLRSEV